MRFPFLPSPLYALLFVLVIAISGCASAKSPQALRILLITGGGWHDYNAQQRLLIEGLNTRIGNIQWTVVHEGNKQPDHLTSILKQDNWADPYDLVIHNTGFGRVTDSAFVAQFIEHHRQTPALLIHSAVHSYRYAEPAAQQWFEFSGAQSMWHEDERVFTVENIAPDNPIMENFPEHWNLPVSEELYVIEKIWGEITPLAQAYGIETKQYHPVIWQHTPEGNRIFAITLGHNSDMFKETVFMDTIAQGARWAIGDL